MHFVADVMLSRLARWLRLLGVSVSPAESPEDDLLLKQCLKEKATLLTRDEKLAQRARDYVPCLLFRSNSLEQQMMEFCQATGFPLSGIRLSDVPSLSRCPLCNHALRPAPKSSVKNAVRPRSFARHRLFWRCVHCKQVYWKGSHEKKIRYALQKMKLRVKSASF